MEEAQHGRQRAGHGPSGRGGLEAAILPREVLSEAGRPPGRGVLQGDLHVVRRRPAVDHALLLQGMSVVGLVLPVPLRAVRLHAGGVRVRGDALQGGQALPPAGPADGESAARLRVSAAETLPGVDDVAELADPRFLPQASSL